MTPFVRKYTNDTYGTAVYVVFSPTAADGIRALPKPMSEDNGRYDDACAVTLSCADDNMVAMVFVVSADDVVSHRAIAHECWHATDCVMCHVGVTIRKSDSNEAWAYLCGWMAEKVYDAGERYVASLGGAGKRNGGK